MSSPRSNATPSPIEITTPGAAGDKPLNTTLGRLLDWFAANGSYVATGVVGGSLAVAQNAINRAAHTKEQDDTLANIILQALRDGSAIIIPFFALLAAARRKPEMEQAAAEALTNPQARGLLDTLEIPSKIHVPKHLFWNKEKALPNMANPRKWNKVVEQIKTSRDRLGWQAEMTDNINTDYLQKILILYNTLCLLLQQTVPDHDDDHKNLYNKIAFWGTLALIFTGFVIAGIRKRARTGFEHARQASNVLHRIFTDQQRDHDPTLKRLT